MNGKIFFGETEAAIMESIWDHGPQTVRDVLSRLHHRSAYTTVMTIMNRLVEQGCLKRQRSHSGAFLYLPTRTREQHTATVTKANFARMVEQYGDTALVQFLDVLDDIPPERLRRLRRKRSRS